MSLHSLYAALAISYVLCNMKVQYSQEVFMLLDMKVLLSED